jgi:FolB domain-containing protein
VGINPEERKTPRHVFIDLTMHVDLAAAGRSDDISDTVDYRTVRDAVYALVSNSSFGLIEALAEAVAACCLEDRRVRRVDVVLEKPGALRHAAGVAVSITRPAAP